MVAFPDNQVPASGNPGLDGGVRMGGAVSPSDWNDMQYGFYTHWANLGKGGRHSGFDVTTRDALHEDIREFGMAYVCTSGAETGTVYILSNVASGGVDNDKTNNANWIKFAGGSDCPFNGNIVIPSGNVSGTTCEDFKNLFFPSQPPTMSIRGTVAFGLYEVGQILTTPLIEVRGALGSNPAGTLTNLSIVDPVFSQTTPTPGTRYGTNDGDITITLGTTKTYNGNLTDSEGRNANASGGYRGAFPYYGTSANITTLTKQTLRPNTNTYFQVDMVAETGGDKYKADFETANVTVSGIQFYNTVSGTRERMGGSQANSLLLRTQSAVTHTVQGNVINYTRYTHNGLDGGVLQVRFYN